MNRAEAMSAEYRALYGDEVEIRSSVAFHKDKIFKIRKNAERRIEKEKEIIKNIQSVCPHHNVRIQNMVSLCSSNETLYTCNICGKEWEGR